MPVLWPTQNREQRPLGHIANAELDAALEVAKRYQEDMVRHGVSVPMPKEVSAEEMERHQLTHLPKADWCEACTATKSREHAHKSLVSKGDAFRTIMHMDFGYLTGEAKPGEKAPSTTFLCAVDSQTKWVTAIRVPSKDRFGLKYVVQQLVNATAGMGAVRLMIRTDQEPALKQIARTWQSLRAALKLRSEIQLVAVGQHQGLLAERYIQTVRRQALCLLQELEAKPGVSITPGSVMSTWAIRHSGWLLNRFQPASGQGGQTPYEIRFERSYAGKLVPFETTVFARTLPGRPKGIAQFQKAIFLGKIEDSDTNLVGTISGTRVARTIRRSVTLYQADCLLQVTGVPWNFSQEALGVKVNEVQKANDGDSVPFVDEEAEAVKKAALYESSSDGEPDEALLKAFEEQPPSNPPIPPRSPEAQLRAPMLEEKGTKRPMEEPKGVKRQAEAEPPSQAGTGMDTETHEHHKRALEEGSAAEGSPSRARTEPDASPSAQPKLYPPSFAGNVSRVELWEPDLMVATVQESGDQFLFGADDEDTPGTVEKTN